MSAPAPVPSKAAIHALRGLLFGTSCSLVLLAEERRQRIKIARSAVENGRRLKSLKRYSSSGVVALEALQEEVATDPSLISWPARSRSRTSTHDHGRLAFDSSYLDQHVNETGPDARRPTRATSEQDLSQKPSDQRGAIQDSGRPATDAAKKHSHDPFWSRFPSSVSAIQDMSIEDSVLRSIRDRPNGWPGETNAIDLAVECVIRDHPDDIAQTAGLEELLLNSTSPQLRQGIPHAALNLVRRAYRFVDQSQALPDWFSELSSLLSTACHRRNNFRIAGQILEFAVHHNVATENDVLAQCVLEVTEILVPQKTQQSAKNQDPPERLQLAASLYVGNLQLPPLEQSKIRSGYVKVGKDLISRALEVKCPIDVVQVFQQVSTWNHDKLGTIVWFMMQLFEHQQHKLAIDTFIEIFAKLRKTSAYSKRLCMDIVHSVVTSRGYECREVLHTFNQLRERDGWEMPRKWLRDLLWVYWNSTRNFTETLQLFEDARGNDFYGVQNTLEIRSKMVRICIEAKQAERAHLLMEELASLYPEVQHDVEIFGQFALQKANQGDWAGVLSDFEAMKKMQTANSHNERHFKRTFAAVLETYAKTHTWGEVETFMETYIPEFGLGLDRQLVTFIADRHAKCRDMQALKRWLMFCMDAGYTTDGRFWTAMLVSCKRDWKYNKDQLSDLYRAMRGAGISTAFPGLEQCFKNLSCATGHRSKQVRLKAYMVSPAHEVTAFESMRADAQIGKWNSVLALYKRALHNGMGHTSRCLKLAITAIVQLEGPRSRQAVALLSSAQSEGCDTKEAMYPIVFSQLEEIGDHHKGLAGEDGRGRPFPYLKAVFDDLRSKNLHIDDGLFNRAARICQELRNYREMITFCIIAAEINGRGDLCYSVYNFSNLLAAYVIRHEYDKVRWLLAELKTREYRTSREIRHRLYWAIHYLRKSSEADKAEELKQSDLEIMALVHDACKALVAETRDHKIEVNEVLLSAMSQSKFKSKATGKADSLEPKAFEEEQEFDMTSEEEDNVAPPALPTLARRVQNKGEVPLNPVTMSGAKETESQPVKRAFSWSSTTLR
ncbi:hypothetical protein CORC01_09478 [Colletotrichum orchidophilum]|uniref:Uncharacterized protein n=1 Tax=Colletotrichum orchidophilum TaxID=1209926 RepID=A0A1G4B1G8_9PEZI|nr:uncharacterized protein CORC01_09478 [Colletotrichum orchidophilum]OHE95217.1 hypothetical protein CORC01_09478 [Colletotrichum orchidophilum]